MKTDLIQTANFTELYDLLSFIPEDTAFLLLFYGPDFPYKRLYERLRRFRIPFLGCMDRGRMFDGSFIEATDSVTVMSFSKKLVKDFQIISYDMRPSMNRKLIHDASAYMYSCALASMSVKPEERNDPHLLTLNLLYGPGSSAPILVGQHRILPVTTIGASSGCYANESSVISSSGRGAIGATVMIRLHNDFVLTTGRSDCFEPTDMLFRVTGMKNRRMITELNGKPALKELASSLNIDEESLKKEALYEYGFQKGKNTVLGVGEVYDTSLCLCEDLLPDTELRLLRVHQGLDARTEKLALLARSNPLCYLSFDSFFSWKQRNIYGSQAELSMLYDNALPGVPKAGFACNGEHLDIFQSNFTETHLAVCPVA